MRSWVRMVAVGMESKYWIEKHKGRIDRILTCTKSRTEKQRKALSRGSLFSLLVMLLFLMAQNITYKLMTPKRTGPSIFYNQLPA